jgi:Ca2+-binding EF-hand superfamily protein
MCKRAIRGADETVDAEERIRAVFKEFDANGDNFLTLDELVQVLRFVGHDFSLNDANLLLKDVDLNGDHVIDTSEFVAWLFKAPSLEEYFAVLNKISLACRKESEAMINAMIASMDAEVKGQKNEASTDMLGKQLETLQTKFQRLYEQQLSPLIKKSVIWYAQSSNGLLEKDESILFFASFVAEFAKSMDGFIEASCLQSMKGAGTIDEPREAVKLKKNMCEMIQAKIDGYRANIAEFQKKSFACIDTNKDGRLQEAELIAALVPGTRKNVEFLQAIGLYVDPAEVLAVGMDKGVKDVMGLVGECPQM